jgi:hypothetical protein
MEKLKKELRQSVQEIRSRYEYNCAQFTIDLFDDIETDIEDITAEEVSTILGSTSYRVSIAFEIVDPSLVDSLAIRDLNKLFDKYSRQYS